MAGTSLNVGQTNHTDIAQSTTITITPTTTGGAAENYIFTIENTNIVRFSGEGPVATKTSSIVTLKTQSINTAATTTVTIQGVNSGIVQTVTISVKADAASTTPPDGSQEQAPS